jgi:hypothetical protein
MHAADNLEGLPPDIMLAYDDVGPVLKNPRRNFDDRSVL